MEIITLHINRVRKLLPSSNQLFTQETIAGGSSSLVSPSSLSVSQTAGQSMGQALADLTSLNLLQRGTKVILLFS